MGVHEANHYVCLTETECDFRDEACSCTCQCFSSQQGMRAWGGHSRRWRWGGARCLVHADAAELGFVNAAGECNGQLGPPQRLRRRRGGLHTHPRVSIHYA